MTSAPITIVTCSYGPDASRCRRLCRSIDRFVPATIEHCIIVPRRDYPLFRDLHSGRRRVHVTEEVVPGKFRHLPTARKMWLGPGAWPVRGWIMQQVTKLSANFATDAELIVFADPDAGMESSDGVTVIRMPRHATYFQAPVVYTIQAAYLHLANKLVTGADIRFGSWFSFTAWADFVSVFGALAGFNKGVGGGGYGPVVTIGGLLSAGEAPIMTTVPSTGDQLPCVGIGTNRYRGDPASAGEMEPFLKTLEAFHENGGRVIDTSPNYGNSEEVLGRLLTELNRRDDVFMATKVDREDGAEGKQRLCSAHPPRP